MNADQKFLEEAPEGFDPTMELKWVTQIISVDEAVGRGAEFVAIIDPVLNPMLHYRMAILCQKYRGAFRDCWVMVPIQEA